MKKLLLSFIALSIYTVTFSQDLVILKTGQKFENCKITREDSVNVYFNLERDSQMINTFAAREKIERYLYNYRKANKELLDSIYGIKAIDTKSIGLGIGLDYGGIVGFNILLYPQQNIGVFGGAGYAFIGLGYNVGIKFRTKMQYLNPYFTCMYGYNTVIKVTNASEYDKFFYGPTVGFGFDIPSSRHRTKGYFTFALLFPIRGEEVTDYIDYLKNSQNIEFKSGLIPIAISLGYRFVF